MSILKAISSQTSVLTVITHAELCDCRIPPNIFLFILKLVGVNYRAIILVRPRGLGSGKKANKNLLKMTYM